MYLHEEVLLLALKDDTGKIDWKAGHFQHVMAGALVADLMLEERVEISDSKKKTVTVIDTAPHENAVLNDVVQAIKNAKRPKKIQHWINELAGLKDLKDNTAADLCRKGVLKEATAKLLFVIPTTVYPESNPEPERKLIARLERAIFGEGDVDARTCILISLTHQSGLLSIPFSSKALKGKKQRLKEISDGELVGEATGDAIATVQNAAAAIAVMPAITAGSCSPGSTGC